MIILSDVIYLASGAVNGSGGFFSHCRQRKFMNLSTVVSYVFEG